MTTTVICTCPLCDQQYSHLDHALNCFDQHSIAEARAKGYILTRKANKPAIQSRLT